ncbi:uncharacterized protein N7518_002951 [Penicillium psychrosexuale]|uniref:uncharacterized protein n=1 Tax=Penicillium psychrosexuale TaxID=1002107 RepID=UPI002545A230|nr:uncharacterized protein N7518_002951 [Penicillium psychrosexuale]KAJ5800883.1 hypothetical protein N7518_002951 [Penicillium psychrosexuale]
MVFSDHLSDANRLAQWSLCHPNIRPAPNLPFHEKIEFDKNGDFLTPPPGVALSDTLVFLAITYSVPIRQRNAKWPADFHTDGDVYSERRPRGCTVVLWALGLSFIRSWTSERMSPISPSWRGSSLFASCHNGTSSTV